MRTPTKVLAAAVLALFAGLAIAQSLNVSPAFNGGTVTQPVTISGNTVSGTPALSLTGTAYAGSTPMLGILANGATAPTWNSNGTIFGLNSPSGWNGYLAGLYQNGTAELLFTNAGGIQTAQGLSNISNTSNSAIWAQSTGALIARNIADANPVLLVQNQNASSTGDLLRIANSAGTQVTFSQSGMMTMAAAGAASASLIHTTGAAFSGGTTSTTTPLVYFDCTGATQPSFNTSGTILGTDSCSGFSGLLLGLYANGNAVLTASSGGTVTIPTKEVLGSVTVFSSTAPTISSGFGTSPTVTTGAGTNSFKVTIGTGGTATSGVLTMPAATNGWNCQVTDETTTSATVFITKETADTTTSVTVGNFSTAAAASAWTAGDVLLFTCVGR